MITYFLILTPLLAAALGYTIIPKIVELSHELHIFDLPDSRKVHKLPVPRLGGVVFLPIVIIAVAVAIVVMLRFNIDTERLWKGTVVQTFVAYLGGVMMLYIV